MNEVCVGDGVGREVTPVAVRVSKATGAGFAVQRWGAGTGTPGGRAGTPKFTGVVLAPTDR